MRSFIIWSLHQVVRVIKSRKLKWAGHVARMGDVKYFAWKTSMEETSGKT
jgi:hypothetical protein